MRWASIDSFLQRLGYLLSIRHQNISLPNIQDTDSCCPKPVWLSGGSLPLCSQNNRRAVNFVDGLRQGIEFAIFRGIHLGITALAIYQLNSWLHEPTSSVCQHDTETKRNLFGLLAFYENSDDNVLLSVFHDVLSPDSKVLDYLRYGLLFPFAFGLGKGGWNTRNSQMTNEEITEELQKIQAVTPSFYNDLIRWLLPLPPIDRATGNLIKNMLWNGDLKAEELQRIFDTLDGLAKSNRWYTAIHGLGYLAPIVYGMNTYDLQKLSQKERTVPTALTERLPLLIQNATEPTAHDQSAINKRLELKAKALLTLQELARLHDKDGQRKSIIESGIAIYAQYLLWSLGASRSWYEAAGQTAFKGGKLYLQAKFLHAIVEAFLAARQCPKQPGVSLAGVEPWAKDLTQQCFDAYVRLFNVIPGQPTDTLAGNLDQYHFPGCIVSLDLSNKALDWKTIYNITKALLDHNISIGLLNLSGNDLGAAEVFRDVFPTFSTLTSLDLSNNNIGLHDAVDASATMALGEGIGASKALTALDLSFNQIGYGDYSNASGTVALGEGIGALKVLTSLDLSINSIGHTDSVNASGTVALGRGIRALKALTSLNLFNNEIGGGDNNNASGTVALGEGIGALRALTFLNLSANDLGEWDNSNASGTVALGEGIGNLESLTILSLARNQIGAGDYSNSNGTVALGKGIGKLSHLKILDLSRNAIGCNNGLGVDSIIESIAFLHRLKFFDFIPQLNWTAVEGLYIPTCLLSSVIQNLNMALHHTEAPPLFALVSPEDVDRYCETLPFSVQTVNLSTCVPNPEPLTISALMACLKNKSLLISLDLSNNAIGVGYYIDTSGTVALGNGLRALKTLTSLDLSRNGFGSYDNVDASGTVALGEGIGALRALTSLDLSYNLIGSQDGYNPSGTVAFGKGIGALRALTFLDFSFNNIGLEDWNDASAGTVALGEGIGALKELTSLDLSGNDIGSSDYYNAAGTVALGRGIRMLKALTSLNLFNNRIGGGDNSDTSGTVAFGKGIGALRSLTSLVLSGNEIGEWDDSNATGTVALGEGISTLKVLTSLDLSQNKIGEYDNVNASGTIALGEGIGALRSLIYLNLIGNYIGTNDNVNVSGTVALGEGIGALRTLTSLGLSDNAIGYQDGYNPSGTVALGEGIGVLRALTALGLSYNKIGSGDFNNASGTLALGKGIGALKALTFLDLSSNDIGLTRSVIELAKGLNYTRHLKTLNLGYNHIGSGGAEGPYILLSVLPNLLELDFGTLNVAGMTNISWTKSASGLQQLRSSEMKTACRTSSCFGGDISSSSQGTTPVSQQLAFSQRHAMALDVSEVIPISSSGAYAPSLSFWGEAAKGVSTIYQTLWEVASHPEMQRIGWTVVASKFAYATFQTWPLLATYVVLT